MLNWIQVRWKQIAAGLSVGTLLGLFAILDYLRKWGVLSRLWILIGRFLSLLAMYWLHLVVTLIAVCILMLWRRLYRLERYVAMYFKDDFRKDLDKNWNYYGKWQLVHGGELSVTQSGIGGITRVGHLWTDYVFEFTAVIVNDRIGWIVRAQDLFNYYMIQLTPTSVRPHLCFGGRWPLILEQEHGLSISLNDPIKIRTEVRGLEVRVYVNDKEVYYDNEFFSMKFITVKSKEDDKELEISPLQPSAVVVPAFTTGRVGFRMAGAEHGRFSRCRVRPL